MTEDALVLDPQNRIIFVEDDPRLLPFDFRIWKPIELKQFQNTFNHGLDLKRSQDNPGTDRVST